MAKAEIDADVARLEEQIALLRADVSRIVEALGQLGHDTSETLKATLTEKADDLRAQGEAKFAQVSQNAEATFAEITGYARDKPLQSLAIAGGAGLLLGLLFGRR